MVAEYAKPVPVPDQDTQPFWDACKGHELQVQQCLSCGKFRWPPRGLCPHCRSWDFAWVPVKGTGEIFSFVVVHYVSVPAFTGDAPYVIAQISVDGTDGQMRLTSNIVGCPWEQVRVGMPVTVVFEDVTPKVTLAKFRPV